MVKDLKYYLQLCGANLFTFAVGLSAAYPSVLNPAILGPNSEIKATPDQASWITACLSIAGIPGYVLTPTIFEIFGRKPANLASNGVTFIGCVVYYFSKDIYALAFARFMQGLSLAGMFTSIIYLCETIAPKRRGYFLVLNKISLALGALTCHGLAFVLNWRQIAIFNMLPTCLSMIIALFFAESPCFFAMQGKFDKCNESFKWYRGNSLEANEELKNLVTAQMEIYRMKQKEKYINIFKKIIKMMKCKVFRKSFFMVTLAKLGLDFCGRYFILAYITQIFMEVTNDKSLAMHLSLVSDVVAMVALSISYFLVKSFDRRVLLFNLGFFSTFLMFVVSLTLVLDNRLHLLDTLKWLTPIVILAHLFVTNVGLIPLVFAVTGEIYSLEHRAIGSFLSGTVFLGFYTLILKCTPYLIDVSGVEGVYFVYGTCLLIILTLLRMILIETKDKTLQQIEDELKGKEENLLEMQLLNNPKVNYRL